LQQEAEHHPELLKFLEHGYFWDRVETVEDAGIQHCYDLTVPNGHAFIANGIVNHNTSFCETITDAWRQMDRNHILWWGAEWTWEKMADRAITRYGDTKTPTASLTEIMLHEMYLAEEAAGVPEKGRYGRKLPDFVYRSSIATSQLIEKWPGKSHYLERMNIEFDALMAQFEQRVLALEAEGNRPKVAVFDYVQLLDLPNMRTEGDRITAALGRIKAFCVDYKLVGIVASQVTKNTSKDARENGQLIDAEAGQFFRSDKFNLVLTLNPIYENGLLTTKGVIRVAKNSVGRTGQQKVFIDPARFKWLAKKVESQSTDEIIEEAFSNAEIEF
jgi:hypothetical protein